MRHNITFHLLQAAALAALSAPPDSRDGYGIGGPTGASAKTVTQASPNCTQVSGNGSTSITCTKGLNRCTTTSCGSNARTLCESTRPYRRVDPFAAAA